LVPFADFPNHRKRFTLRARLKCPLTALSAACGTGVQRAPDALANEHCERVKYPGKGHISPEALQTVSETVPILPARDRRP